MHVAVIGFYTRMAQRAAPPRPSNGVHSIARQPARCCDPLAARVIHAQLLVCNHARACNYLQQYIASGL